MITEESCLWRLSDACHSYARTAASLARKVYMRQNVGVGAFRKQYGGRNKRKGTVPEHYARASGGLIRHILKQLEARAWLCYCAGVRLGCTPRGPACLLSGQGVLDPCVQR